MTITHQDALKLKAALCGKTVLVTGASGFIGDHLCRRLHQFGAEVHALSRSAQRMPDDSMRWWQGDLVDLEVVRRLVTAIRPDIVFHMAGYVSGARGLTAVLPALQGNLVSTLNLLISVTEQGCGRVVMAGSLEEPDPGDIIPAPVSPYAASKWSVSAYARMFNALYETPVTIARLFMVYGPGQRDLLKLVPYVTLTLLRGRAPKLTSGNRLVDWIYVDDVVEGLLAMAEAPDLSGRTVDIGSGRLVPIKSVAQSLKEIIGSQVELAFGNLPDRPLERIRAADNTDAYARLGWKPLVSLEDGLNWTVTWYAERLQAGAFDLSQFDL